MILAQISAPTPNWGQPPSTVTRWLVFITLASILCTSIGRMVRRLITWCTDTKFSRLLSAGHLYQFVPRGVSVYLALDSLLGEDSSSVQTVTDVPRVTGQSDVSTWRNRNTEGRSRPQHPHTSRLNLTATKKHHVQTSHYEVKPSIKQSAFAVRTIWGIISLHAKRSCDSMWDLHLVKEQFSLGIQILRRWKLDLQNG